MAEPLGYSMVHFPSGTPSLQIPVNLRPSSNIVNAGPCPFPCFHHPTIAYLSGMMNTPLPSNRPGFLYFVYGGGSFYGPNLYGFSSSFFGGIVSSHLYCGSLSRSPLYHCPKSSLCQCKKVRSYGPAYSGAVPKVRGPWALRELWKS